ncbi:MAG: DUF4956 domain-containing protein [Lachnospiraceae bacterium]|nr:DUF4956 domain-containing protein [Lachnospiraceae bacterium]
MNYVKIILDNIISNYEHPSLSQSTILAVLFMVLILSLLEFAVYRLVSHRSFYNKSFNIALAILPFFIATIILSLQSNLVITLGTIGALAIIRFRTAIKNPTDMLYLLWSIHIGITCGCQLYELAVATFIIVTILLLVFEKVNLGKKPFVLVFHADNQKEAELTGILSANTRSHRIKSRNYTANGTDFVVEISTDNTEALASALKNAGIGKLSIIEYDSDDLL